MKIIDILNKIANGEEVPKKIMFRGNILNYEEGIDYIDNHGQYLFNRCCISKEELNEEVEIIEEKEYMNIPKINTDYFYTLGAKERDGLLKEKINEIIDYINKENK